MMSDENTAPQVEEVSADLSQPEKAPEPQEDPMRLLPQEVLQLRNLQNQSAGLMNAVAKAAYEQHMLCQKLDQIEAQGKLLLEGVRERLGIEQNIPWRVNPNGVAEVMENYTPGQGNVPPSASPQPVPEPEAEASEE